MTEEGKKKIVSNWNWVWIVLCVLMIVYVILQNSGIHMVKKAEQVEITDDPHPGH